MISIPPVTRSWLDQLKEAALEPERPTIDLHHPLWKRGLGFDYRLDEFWQDTGSGHNIRKSVFMECHAFYDRQLPVHLRSLGETRASAAVADSSRLNNQGQPCIAGLACLVALSLAGQSERLLREVIEQQ